MIVRCTARLLTELGVRRGGLGPVEPGPDDWYANVLLYDRRRCLLLAHASTLFGVFVPRVSKRDLAAFGPLLSRVIGEVLEAERLPGEVLGSLDPGELRLAVTASRQVLGHMNDMRVYVDHAIGRAGSLDRVAAASVNRTLQRVLHRHDDGYHEPLDLVRGRLPPRADAEVELQVTLEHLPLPVTRRLLVPGHATLEELDRALQLAFAWNGSHLSGFWVDEPWHGPSFVHPDHLTLHDDADVESTRTARVSDVLGRVGDTLHWIYDYGDEWRHTITAEALHAASGRRIRCTEGTNAAPPDDCGGPPGYEHLLEAIADPQHREHEELTEWLGRDFDPTAFDLERTNASLAAVRVRG